KRLGSCLSEVVYWGFLPEHGPAIQPLKPLVERGGTIQLICSMDCPEAEVQWEGLDTDLGNIVSNHTQSILTLSNTTINMEGTKMCSGWCQETSYLATVELNVYCEFKNHLLEKGSQKTELEEWKERSGRINMFG
uniref:Ig-like domain-containing protein n=1 Tax=Laticauda laticaudata TaxID=8630 RepID=A0A8C5SWS6_LATLA